MKAFFKSIELSFILRFILVLLVLGASTYSLKAQDKVFWSDRDLGGIYSTNMDGSSFKSVMRDRPDALAVDTIQKRLYWGERRGIYSSNYDFTDITTVLAYTTATPVYPDIICLDLVNDKMYFANWYQTGYSILRINLDGTDFRVLSEPNSLLGANLGNPRGMAIDLVNNHLYTANTKTIFRVDLDPLSGEMSNLTKLYDGKFSYLSDFNIDPRNNKIYIEDDPGMKIGNLDGTGELTSVSFPSLYTLSVDPLTRTAFYDHYIADEIRRINFDGTGSRVIGTGYNRVNDIVNTREHIANTTEYATLSTIEINKTVNIDDGSSFLFESNSLGNFSLKAEGVKLFKNPRIGNHTLTLTPLDRWALTDILITGDTDNGSQIDLVNGIVNIDLDEGEEVKIEFISEVSELSMEVFWTNASQREIVSGDFNGKSVKPRVSSSPQVYGIVADSVERKVYWTTADQIYKANFDGTEIERLLGSPSGLGLLYWLALDLINGKIYFIAKSTSTNKEGIYRSNLDGTELQLLTTFETLGPGLTNSKAIQVDAEDGYLYFNQSSPAKVYRLDLDPVNGTLSNLTDLFPAQVGIPHDIAVDPKTNLLYVADTDEKRILIGTANGTGTLQQLSTIHNPLKISLDLPNQRILYLNNLNGRKSIHTISLDGSKDSVLFDLPAVINDVTSVHEPISSNTASSNLSSLEIRLTGYIPSDSTFPFEMDNGIAPFSLKTTQRKAFDELSPGTYTITQQSLEGYRLKDILVLGDLDNGSIIDLSTGTAMIDLDEGENIVITYENGINLKPLYWTDVFPGNIWSSNIDGTELAPLFTDVEGAMQLAIDEKEEKVYWSNTGNSEVSRGNLDGSGREVILGYNDGLSTPQALGVDSKNKRIYFYEDYYTDFLNPALAVEGIMRAELDGSGLEVAIDFADVNLEGINVSFISIDEQNDKLYFIRVNNGQNGLFRLDIGADGNLTNLQELFQGQLGKASDFSLDVGKGKIFINDVGTNTSQGRLLVGNIDGTGQLTELTTHQYVFDLAADPLAEHVFYKGGYPYSFRKVYYDGTGDEELFAIQGEMVKFVLLKGNFLNDKPVKDSMTLEISISGAIPDEVSFNFLGDGGIGSFSLKKEEKKSFDSLEEGSYQLTLEKIGDYSLTDITISGDSDNGSTIDLENGSVTIDLDEGENISISFIQEQNPIIPLSTYGEIFWSYNRDAEIRSSKFSGQEITTLVTEQSTKQPFDLVIDTLTRKVYWVDVNPVTKGIHVADLDGSNHQNLTESTEVSTPLYLELDPVNQKIYFFDLTYKDGPHLLRMDTHGGNVEVVRHIQDFDLISISSIEIDLLNNFLYLSTSFKIVRLDLDPISGALSNPYLVPIEAVKAFNDLLIELDEVNCQMYFSGKEKGSGNYKIMVANLDGSGTPKTIFEEKENMRVGDLSLDLDNGHLYYSNRYIVDVSDFQFIKRIKLDGSNDTTILTQQLFEGRFATINEPMPSADAVTRIKVSNKSSKDSEVTYAFSGAPSLGDFELLSNDLEVFPHLEEGTYSITQVPLDEAYLVDIQIEGDIDQGSIKNVSGGRVTVDLDEDEDILVRFINCYPDTVRLSNQSCKSSEVGVDTLLLTNSAGCDSLIITSTNWLPSDTTYLTAITCDPEEVDTTLYPIVNAGGCDSLLIVHTQLIEDQQTVPLSLGDTLVCRNESLLMVARVDSPSYSGLWQVYHEGEWVSLLNEEDDTIQLAAPIPLGEVSYRYQLVTNCDTLYSDSIVVSSEDCERPSVLGYQITDAIMDTLVTPIDSGGVYYLQDLPEQLNIAGIADLEINRVVMTMEGPVSTAKTERVSPYFLFNPEEGGKLMGGTYRLTTIPYYELDEDEFPGNSLSIPFTIIDCYTEGPLPKAFSRQSISCETGELSLTANILGEYESAYWEGPEGFYSEELSPIVIKEGRYVLTAVGENGCINQKAVMVEPCLESCELGIEKFVLVDSKKNEDIRVLEEEDVIDLSVDGKHLNIRADIICEPKGKSVRLDLSGAQVRTRIERFNPYSLAGDQEADYFNQFFVPGDYKLIAVPYSDPNAEGETGDSLTLSFTVINGTVSEQEAFSNPKDLQQKEVRIYPNPVESILYLEVENFEEGEYQVALFDLAGRVVVSLPLLYDASKGNRFSIDTQALSGGIYLLRIVGKSYQEWRRVSVSR